MKCSHYWFSVINFFEIDEKKLQILARKIERIIKDPAPFIFDDGCCCLSVAQCRLTRQCTLYRAGRVLFLVLKIYRFYENIDKVNRLGRYYEYW